MAKISANKRAKLAGAPTGEARRIAESLSRAGGRPVLVGGWVRDFLLGRPASADFDLEVFGLEPTRLQKVLQQFGPVNAVGRRFGVLKLSTGKAEYDVSVPRRESKTAKGHKGFWVGADPGMTFTEAAARRDFTINAMGYPLLEEGLLLDPFGGERDLRAGVLRHVGPAFGEDPLRVLRAMQFAGRFDLTIAPQTAAVCREQDLAELPRERLWEEFKKLLLLAPNPSRGLLWAGPLGILPTFPELEALAAAPAGRGGVSPWERTLAVVDAAAQLRGGDAQADTVLMFAALCHNFPPPGGGAALPAGTAQGGAAADEAAKKGAGLVSAARNFLERLTNEHRIAAGVTALLRELFQPEAIHARRGEGSAADAQIRWLATRAPVAEVERLARALFVGSAAAGHGPAGPFAAGDWLLQRAEALGVLQGPPQPLLTGHHVKQLGLVEGPGVGDLLKQAFARQMAGQISTLAEAQGWAQARLAELAGSAGGGPAETDPPGPDHPRRRR